MQVLLKTSYTHPREKVSNEMSSAVHHIKVSACITNEQPPGLLALQKHVQYVDINKGVWPRDATHVAAECGLAQRRALKGGRCLMEVKKKKSGQD